MITAWPVVSARKRLRSSGSRHGKRVAGADDAVRATAAISATRRRRRRLPDSAAGEFCAVRVAPPGGVP